MKGDDKGGNFVTFCGNSKKMNGVRCRWPCTVADPTFGVHQGYPPSTTSQVRTDFFAFDT